MDAPTVSAIAAAVSATVTVVSLVVAISARRGALAAKLTAVAAEDRAEKVTKDFNAFVKLHAKQFEQTEAEKQAHLDAGPIADAMKAKLATDRAALETCDRDHDFHVELPTLAHRIAVDLLKEDVRAGVLPFTTIILAPDGSSVTFRIFRPRPIVRFVRRGAFD